MGIVGALQTLPDLFLGMVAGAIADRSDRKRMMFLADLGRACLTALIPISVALGGPTMAVILLVAAPTSILRSFFLAGYTASVPALVGRSQVGKANSYFEAIYSAGYIIGPAIAGVLAATIGPGPTLAIDALSFALSALGLLFVRRDLRAPVDRPRRRLLTEIREGIDFIAAEPTLRTVILFWGATSILLAPLVTALAVHVTRDLGEPASVLGLILASYGVGTVLGSLLTARRIGRGRVAEILLGGNLVIGIALLVVAVSVDDPAPDRCRVRRRDRPVHGAGHVHHAAHGVFARRPARADREHGAVDLAGAPAGRPSRRWRTHRPDQWIRDHRDHRRRGSDDQLRLRPDRGDAARNGDAAMKRVLGSLGQRIADRTADDLDADGATCALELVALGDLDGGRTGAPWALDVEHH